MKTKTTNKNTYILYINKITLKTKQKRSKELNI